MYSIDLRTKELAKSVMQEYPGTFNELGGVNIVYLCSTEKKKSHGRLVFADCQLLNPKMRTISGYVFAITVYEPNMALLDDDQQRLVMWHELHHAEVDGEDEYSIRPHDLEDFRDLIESKGIDYNKPHIGSDGRPKIDEDNMAGQISVEEHIEAMKAAEGKEDA